MKRRQRNKILKRIMKEWDPYEENWLIKLRAEKLYPKYKLICEKYTEVLCK